MSSSIFRFSIFLGLVLLYFPIDCFAQDPSLTEVPPFDVSTTEKLKIDFTCMIGSSFDDCKINETGHNRFSRREVSDSDCQTVAEFLGHVNERNLEEMRSAEIRMLACGSYFNWANRSQEEYEEIHFCVNDTRANIEEATKSKSCVTSYQQGAGHTWSRDTLCICTDTGGQNCNAKFTAGFNPASPKESETLCNSRELVYEEPEEKESENSDAAQLRTLSYVTVLFVAFFIYN